jgi:hypothetical protein
MIVKRQNGKKKKHDDLEKNWKYKIGWKKNKKTV